MKQTVNRDKNPQKKLMMSAAWTSVNLVKATIGEGKEIDESRWINPGIGRHWPSGREVHYSENRVTENVGRKV